MLLRLSWRNIWRNRRRSIIVLLSVAVGVLASVLMDTLSRGMIAQMLHNQVGSHVAHMQIHRMGFHDNPEIQSTVPGMEAVDRALQNTAGIASYSRRVLTYGLVSSASNSSGVSLVGVDPHREPAVTTIKTSLVEGSYLSGRNNEALIGKGLAERLGIGVGDRMVGLASRVDGHVGSDVFRIVGIFQSLSSEFDKANVYIPLANAQSMLGLGHSVSEYAIVVNDLERLEQVQTALRAELDSSYEVLSYQEILPLLVLSMDVYEQSMIIFYVIIGIALIFGIVNTMLMSVFERIHEFGVLKAIGMKDSKVLLMVLSESFLLGIIGTLIGFLLSYALYLPLSETGLDLSAFSEGLRSYGVGAVIYPILTWGVVANALFVIPFVAVLGAVYPAFRAVRLHPVEAIRYV